MKNANEKEKRGPPHDVQENNFSTSKLHHARGTIEKDFVREKEYFNSH